MSRKTITVFDRISARFHGISCSRGGGRLIEEGRLFEERRLLIKIHSFSFIRTIFIRTLRLRFAPKFKKMYGLK